MSAIVGIVFWFSVRASRGAGVGREKSGDVRTEPFGTLLGVKTVCGDHGEIVSSGACGTGFVAGVFTLGSTFGCTIGVDCSIILRGSSALNSKGRRGGMGTSAAGACVIPRYFSILLRKSLNGLGDCVGVTAGAGFMARVFTWGADCGCTIGAESGIGFVDFDGAGVVCGSDS